MRRSDWAAYIASTYYYPSPQVYFLSSGYCRCGYTISPVLSGKVLEHTLHSHSCLNLLNTEMQQSHMTTFETCASSMLERDHREAPIELLCHISEHGTCKQKWVRWEYSKASLPESASDVAQTNPDNFCLCGYQWGTCRSLKRHLKVHLKRSTNWPSQTWVLVLKTWCI